MYGVRLCIAGLGEVVSCGASDDTCTNNHRALGMRGVGEYGEYASRVQHSGIIIEVVGVSHCAEVERMARTLRRKTRMRI